MNREQVEITDLVKDALYGNIRSAEQNSIYPTYLVLDPNLMLFGLQSVHDLVLLQMHKESAQKLKE